MEGDWTSQLSMALAKIMQEDHFPPDHHPTAAEEHSEKNEHAEHGAADNVQKAAAEAEAAALGFALEELTLLGFPLEEAGRADPARAAEKEEEGSRLLGTVAAASFLSSVAAAQERSVIMTAGQLALEQQQQQKGKMKGGDEMRA